MGHDTHLRLEHIKLIYQTTDRAVDLSTRLHLAILAVILTALVTVLLGAIGGQLRADVAVGLGLVLVVAVVTQLHALSRLGRTLARAGKEAADAVESLMVNGGE